MPNARPLERLARPPERLAVDRQPTPIGTALLVTDEDGVLRGLDWLDHEDRMLYLLGLQYRGVPIESGHAPAAMRRAIDAYFDGDLTSLDSIKRATAGTPFQRKVWTTLPTIPPGKTLSYGALASRIGSPKAVRAVGLANGSNPISVVVPCHRVIGSDGSLTGYGGGLDRKRWLLAHEGATFRDGKGKA